MTTIRSLFDFTGNWALPYKEAGYNVVQIDVKLGHDVLELGEEFIRELGPVHGILAAPPCTDFAGSGARHWKVKDFDGRTAASIKLMRHTLWLINRINPKWWVLENPVGRLNSLVPELKPFGPWYFQPYWYGDSYTKKTGLWGRFNHPAPTAVVEPIMHTTANGKKGSWQWAKLGGKSERTKTLRSATPMGFARAFFAMNK